MPNGVPKYLLTHKRDLERFGRPMGATWAYEQKPNWIARLWLYWQGYRFWEVPRSM